MLFYADVLLLHCRQLWIALWEGAAVRLGMFVCASLGLEYVHPGECACRGEGGWRVLVFVSKDRCRICRKEIRKAGPMLCKEEVYEY